MPARPRPNFFSAARRVTDWATFLVSSSNWLFMFSFRFVCSVISSGHTLAFIPSNRKIGETLQLFQKGDVRRPLYLLSEPGEEIVPTKGDALPRGSSVAASNSPA